MQQPKGAQIKSRPTWIEVVKYFIKFKKRKDMCQMQND